MTLFPAVMAVALVSGGKPAASVVVVPDAPQVQKTAA